jgi:hypothetical protein
MSYRARKHPSYDATVFHAQQCAEKHLKARLEEAGIAFSRTHDLLVLHQLVLPVEAGWAVLQPFLIFLDPFALEEAGRRMTRQRIAESNAVSMSACEIC